MLRAETYYTVDCDDCGFNANEIGDYSAWRDVLTAGDTWAAAGGYSSDGIDLCETCAPRCLCGCTQDPDDPFDCCPDGEI